MRIRHVHGLIMACAATLVLAGCGPEPAPAPTLAPGQASKPEQSKGESTAEVIGCDPVITETLKETVDVLFQRGFAPEQTESFVAGAAEYLSCGKDDSWYNHFLAKAPAGYEFRYATWLGDVSSDIYTGDYYDFSDPVSIAESLPDCYKTEEGYKDCRPEFHPYQVAIDGTERIVDNFLVGDHSCRLDDNWRKFCTLPESLDGCWSFAKADLISAPPSRSAMQSRIQLARAVRVDRAAQPRATVRKKPSKPRRSSAPGAAPLPLSAEEKRIPVCEPLQWEYLLPKE